jgi:subtilisin family serine protease
VGLDRIDQRGTVGADSTYGYARSGRGVTIYIVDSGVDGTHPDFGGRVSHGHSFYTATPIHGHGTHVAGTAAGRRYGVAKEARLVSFRVLNEKNRDPADTLIVGLDSVVQHAKRNNLVGRSVINLSIWGYRDTTAVNTAVRKVIETGIPVVTIAGNNSGKNACNYSPSAVRTALTVGATDITDTRWVTDTTFGSNIGPCIDLFAPGADIKSTVPTTSGGFSDPSGYWTGSGTSFAAPHVAGAVARYLEAFPGATPTEVSDSILFYATRDAVRNEDGKDPDTGELLDSPDLLLYRTPWTETLTRAHLTDANSGKCLHVSAGSGTVDTPLLIVTCTDDPLYENQRFTLASRSATGQVRVYLDPNTKCLGVIPGYNAATKTTNPATYAGSNYDEVVIRPCSDPDLDWTLTRRGELRWRTGGMCAHVYGGRTIDETRVILWECNNVLWQQWDPYKR